MMNHDSECIPRGLSVRSRDPAHRGRGAGSICRLLVRLRPKMQTGLF